MTSHLLNLHVEAIMEGDANLSTCISNHPSQHNYLNLRVWVLDYKATTFLALNRHSSAFNIGPRRRTFAPSADCDSVFDRVVSRLVGLGA